ncbi:MFS transporter [Acetobacteraceae bacterium H6797]|nr:MFS transporter [Acetobacteraceae bacterium H6797]
MSLPPALLALAVASFGIGTSEFVIMGLLPEVSVDLGVSIPSAGMLITGYALGVTFGAPILAAATARLPRHSALMGLMALFVIGNLLCAVAPSQATLMAARMITALSHGAFFGLGAVAASQLVPPHQRGQAISLMFAGLTLANVLGVPVGTALGQALGWRCTFWVVVAIGAVAAVTLLRWLPMTPMPRPRSLLSEARVLGQPQVLLAMVMSALASASMFSVFTYLSPLLRDETGFSPREVAFMLLLLGGGLTIGHLLGGRLGDWRLMPSVIGLCGALILVLAALAFTVHDPLLATGGVFLWGMLAFALASPLQLRVVTQAAEAPHLASTVNQGAFNLGNAAGAWISGTALNLGVSLADLPWIAAVLTASAMVLAILSHALGEQGSRQPAV